MQTNEWRRFRGETSQQVLLAITNIWIVRYIHILTGDVFAQSREVPQAQRAIDAPRGQYCAVTTEAQRVHGAGVSTE